MSKVINQVDETKNDLLKTQQRNVELLEELVLWKANSSMLNGLWQMTFAEQVFNVSIDADQINLVGVEKNKPLAIIDYFLYNPAKRMIVMFVGPLSGGGERPFTEQQVHRLNLNVTHTEIKGSAKF